MTKTIVAFHAKCPDGFAAAWACWRKLGDSAEYIPCEYGNPPPDVTGANVYIVDFSFSAAVLTEMAEKAEHITLLDHHVSAQKDLEGLEVPKLYIQFDMEQSGATLAWHFFFGDEPCWLVDYAEDRDLWRHKLPDSHAVNAYLMALPHSFEAFNEAFDLGAEKVAQLGKGCITWQRYYIEATKKLSRVQRFLGHDVPVVNAPYTAVSEVVGELSEGHPFAMGWHQKQDGQVVYSLRSRGGFNVSELAQSCGGGGHKAAAGFTLPKFPWELTEPQEFKPKTPVDIAKEVLAERK